MFLPSIYLHTHISFPRREPSQNLGKHLVKLLLIKPMKIFNIGILSNSLMEIENYWLKYNSQI